MSHSLVIGQDVPEAANGVDSPGSPEISDRPAPHALKCDGRTSQEGGRQDEMQTETETHTDTHHITNNSSPHPGPSCTETPQTHSTPMPTADTQTHSQTPDTHADYRPKLRPNASEDLSDRVFTRTNDTLVTDTTTTTKGRHCTDTQSTDGHWHDSSTHTHCGALAEDGVREEEVKDRMEGQDGQQQEEEKEGEPTEPSLSSSSSSQNPDAAPPSTLAPPTNTAPPTSTALSEAEGDTDGVIDDLARPTHMMVEAGADEVPPPPHVMVDGVTDSVSRPTKVIADGVTGDVPRPTHVLAEVEAGAEDIPRPTHVMAEVRVRGMPERDRVVRGMQDSKSLDELSGACGGGPRGSARGGQAEGGRRATISSELELEGTVSHEGNITTFITKNLEQKIKMSSRPSLDCDSDSSAPVRGRGSLRRPADIPPIDPCVLLDLQRHTQDVAQSVELMMRSLSGTIQNMTALSVGYIQTYRDSVDSLGESVDMSIKGMYTLMARCEELDRSMQPIHALAAQIRDIKRTLDALEAICK